MQKILVSLFDSPKAAADAVRELAENGFGTDSCSIIANETALGKTPGIDMSPREGVSGMGRTLTLQGIGPVQAMGPLASNMMRTMNSGESNNMPLVSTLTQEGVPEPDAHVFAEGVRRGGTLVTVTPDDMRSDQAKEILSRHMPVDIRNVQNEWQQKGWSRFNSMSRPLSENELDWPHSITARPGEADENVAQENWPQDIAARGAEKHEEEERGSNWPENIVDPDQRTDNVDEGTDWPHNITGRPDE